MNYLFIDAGSTVKPENKKIYLDVGNALEFGIIDHHQLLGIEKSATRLVYENAQFIDKDLNTIVLHKSPDLDCISASFLVEYFLQHEEFPAFSEQLCGFLDKVDFGRNIQSIVSLGSLFSVIKSSLKNDDEIVAESHKLIETLAVNEFDAENIPNQIYNQEQNVILLDRNIFEKDLLSAEKKKFSVLQKYTHTPIEVDGLILVKPKSQLFKSWARSQGYDLLIVQWSSKRVVISVKGDGFLSLEGLGDNLNDAEAKKRKELNISIDEPNRVGYNIPDPWYDGRAHGYTIIDAPRSGTLLELDEILDLMKNTVWNKNF